MPGVYCEVRPRLPFKIIPRLFRPTAGLLLSFYEQIVGFTQPLGDDFRQVYEDLIAQAREMGEDVFQFRSEKGNDSGVCAGQGSSRPVGFVHQGHVTKEIAITEFGIDDRVIRILVVDNLYLPLDDDVHPETGITLMEYGFTGLVLPLVDYVLYLPYLFSRQAVEDRNVAESQGVFG